MVPSTLPNLPVVEFYITNVCNLTCENCNRFNNFVFRGWQKWQDHAEDYKRWSELLTFDRITILGGEPLLNPTVLEWCVGIRALWPKSSIQLVSNGYHINRVSGLRDVLRKNKILLCVTLHNKNEENFIYNEIDKFLDGSYKKYENTQQGYIHFASAKLPAGVWTQTGYAFVSNSLRRNSQGDLCLHDSDPTVAHRDCSFVQNKTHHFIKGKLYKCGPVALLPEFDQQYPLAISPADRALLNSYQPYTAEDFARRGQHILDQIQHPLEQCKFCPESLQTHKVQANLKGKAKTINIIERS